ncbi:MAG: metallophosphoesterase [Proteobacteria bacterium]|jgi:Icc protein|nr:metallophosphoesterase [Pseudomonadota bacterium]MDA1237488.1 metallophosphoesterase [Pseudomonadota bacterium]
MLVAQISDTHILAPDQSNDSSLKRISSFKRCVEDINSLSISPDVVIHTGDLTHNGLPEEYSTAKNILKKLKAPFYPTPGNRDGSRSMMAFFANDLNLSQNQDFMIYSVDDFKIRLISLDSLSKSGSKGDFNDAKLKALGGTLSEDVAKPTVLFMHHPPFDVSVGTQPFYEYDRPEAVNELYDVIKDHKQLIGLFCGHIHRTFRSTFYGFRASTMPSIALELSQEISPIKTTNNPVYHLHTFHSSLEYETEIRHA